MHLNQEKNSQMCIEIAVEHGRRYDKLKEENNRGNKGGAPYLRKCRSWTVCHGEITPSLSCLDSVKKEGWKWRLNNLNLILW